MSKKMGSVLLIMIMVLVSIGMVMAEGKGNARKGKFKYGFAFAGENAYRVKEIISVKELIDSLKSEYSLAAA